VVQVRSPTNEFERFLQEMKYSIDVGNEDAVLFAQTISMEDVSEMSGDPSMTPSRIIEILMEL